jgi:hypothetical protein
VSMTERIAAGEVVSATHTLPDSGRRRHRALVICDRPRAISDPRRAISALASTIVRWCPATIRASGQSALGWVRQPHAR